MGDRGRADLSWRRTARSRAGPLTRDGASLAGSRALAPGAQIARYGCIPASDTAKGGFVASVLHLRLQAGDRQKTCFGFGHLHDWRFLLHGYPYNAPVPAQEGALTMGMARSTSSDLDGSQFEGMAGKR